MTVQGGSLLATASVLALTAIPALGDPFKLKIGRTATSDCAFATAPREWTDFAGPPGGDRLGFDLVAVAGASVMDAAVDQQGLSSRCRRTSLARRREA